AAEAVGSGSSTGGSSRVARRSMLPPIGDDWPRRQGMNDTTVLSGAALQVPHGTDLVEWYFQQGWTDGLPVVPPTPAAVEAAVAALGGDPDLVECRVPPRHGGLTREVLAINLVMAGCKAEYAPVVRAALLALAQPAFNLN